METPIADRIDKCSLWCSDTLATLINEYNLKEIIELGTFTGNSLINLLDGVHNVHITCIDAWDETYKFSDNVQYSGFTYQDFLKKITKKGFIRKGLFDWEYLDNTITLQRNDTHNAHLLHNKVDLVYIDATHTKEAVKHDICSWIGKLNSPGFLCGHDYCDQFYGVKEAVNEIFGSITETTTENLLNDVKSNKLLLLSLYTLWIKKI